MSELSKLYKNAMCFLMSGKESYKKITYLQDTSKLVYKKNTVYVIAGVTIGVELLGISIGHYTSAEYKQFLLG